jgi:tetratricopeptide (TPR) repeat protein
MVLKAHCCYYELTDTSLLDAIALAEQALRIEPSSLRVRRMLSLSLTAAMIQGVLPSSPENITRAIGLAREVSRSVPDDVFSRCVLAWALGLDGQHDAAVKELRYGIRLNPTYMTLHSDLAEHYAMLGYVSEALAETDEAIRLSNDDVVSFWRYYTVAVAQFAAGNYAAAVENARRVLRDKPGLIRAALFLAASAAALGFKDEAEQAIRFVLTQRPEIRLHNVAPGFMPRYVQDSHHAQFLAQLKAAGLPE